MSHLEWDPFHVGVRVFNHCSPHDDGWLDDREIEDPRMYEDVPILREDGRHEMKSRLWLKAHDYSDWGTRPTDWKGECDSSEDESLELGPRRDFGGGGDGGGGGGGDGGGSAGGGGGAGGAAAVAKALRPCFAFRKGQCQRGSGCRFSHSAAGGGRGGAAKRRATLSHLWALDGEVGSRNGMVYKDCLP
jgi:hypothetical protein